MTIMPAAPLFVFLDESGNLDFSAKGSKYWSLTAVCTYSPVRGRSTFAEHHYELAAGGVGIEYFHATEDKQSVRDRMFENIIKLEDASEVHSVLAEKRKAHPSLYKTLKVVKGKQKSIPDEARFYNLVCRTLLKYVIGRGAYRDATSFVIILSSLFTKEKQSQIEGALKSAIKSLTTRPFHVYFRANKTDINCQIADYCGWAITVAWERDEKRPLNAIKSIVRSQFDLFKRGTNTFY
jgi:Protein of unknown function (DUF3800)